MLCGKEILEETEKRYKERTAQRETMERQIKSGAILEANAPERVQARLKRLGLDERVTDFFISSKKARLRPWEGFKELPTARSIDPTAPTSTRPPTIDLPTEDNLNDLILERIIGRNDLMAISYMDLGLQASRSVTCMRLFQNKRHIGSGTGFMVSPRVKTALLG